MDDAEQNEDVGDEDRGEEFEEVLDPEMDDPETPEIGSGEVISGVSQQADSVKGRDRQRGEEEEPRQIASRFGTEPAAKSTIEDGNPEEESDDEKDLPQAPEVEILEALIAEPTADGASLHSGEFSEKTADNHDDERTEQGIGKRFLAARLVPRDHRDQKNARGKVGGGDPEDGELKVPGADNVIGEQAAKIDAEEGLQVGALVFGRSSEHGLDEE